MDKRTLKRQRKKAGAIGGSATTRAKRLASQANGETGGRIAKLDPNEGAFAIVAAAERLTQQARPR